MVEMLVVEGQTGEGLGAGIEWQCRELPCGSPLAYPAKSHLLHHAISFKTSSDPARPSLVSCYSRPVGVC